MHCEHKFVHMIKWKKKKNGFLYHYLTIVVITLRWWFTFTQLNSILLYAMSNALCPTVREHDWKIFTRKQEKRNESNDDFCIECKLQIIPLKIKRSKIACALRWWWWYDTYRSIRSHTAYTATTSRACRKCVAPKREKGDNNKIKY